TGARPRRARRASGRRRPSGRGRPPAPGGPRGPCRYLTLLVAPPRPAVREPAAIILGSGAFSADAAPAAQPGPSRRAPRPGGRAVRPGVRAPLLARPARDLLAAALRPRDARADGQPGRAVPLHRDPHRDVHGHGAGPA